MGTSVIPRAQEQENAKDTATIRGRRDTTYRDDDIGHLAERLVREMRRPLMFARLEADEDEFIGDVALFGYQGHDARVSGRGDSVKLERCHGGL